MTDCFAGIENGNNNYFLELVLFSNSFNEFIIIRKNNFRFGLNNRYILISYYTMAQQ